MPITCPASTCRPSPKTFHCLIRTCTKTSKLEEKLKIPTIGRRHDLTLDQRNIVIGMLTAGTMKKQIARHFQACECTISSLRTKSSQTGSIKNRYHPDRPRKTTRREDINNVTSSRRNRFLNSTLIPGFVRKATGTRKTARRFFN